MSVHLDDPSQVTRHGNTLQVSLWYPPRAGENGNARFIEIDLVAVRAADAFRVHCDFDRDGYVIERPRRTQVLVASGGAIDWYEEREEWFEAAFLPAWPFAVEEEK